MGQIEYAQTGPEDTLLDIAYRNKLGYEETLWANPGLDPWLPDELAKVLLPTSHVLPGSPRTGIVINLPEMRLYHFQNADVDHPAQVQTFPIGIGKLGWSPPKTLTRISRKLIDPTWRIPDSIKREHAETGEQMPDSLPPGPDNPLGKYALQVGQSNYLIHGTNHKYGIGMRVSHGCIRLYPEDIEQLFHDTPSGTPVRIIDQPYKVGWRDGTLYLESHPPLSENAREANMTAMVAEVIRATNETRQYIDWELAWTIAAEARGIPLPIGRLIVDKDSPLPLAPVESIETPLSH